MKKILLAQALILGLSHAVFAAVPNELIGVWQFKGGMDFFPERITFTKEDTFTTERLFIATDYHSYKSKVVSCVAQGFGTMVIDEPHGSADFLIKGTIISMKMLYPAPGSSLESCNRAIADLAKTPYSYYMQVTNLDTTYSPAHERPTFTIMMPTYKRTYQKDSSFK